ncbi:MAG: hypothetical protein ACLVJ8_10995, partial [Ruthenibacterium lactatiformans]
LMQNNFFCPVMDVITSLYVSGVFCNSCKSRRTVIISNLPILCYPHTGILRKAERWHPEGRFNHIFELCGLRIRLFVR